METKYEYALVAFEQPLLQAFTVMFDETMRKADQSEQDMNVLLAQFNHQSSSSPQTEEGSRRKDAPTTTENSSLSSPNQKQHKNPLLDQILSELLLGPVFKQELGGGAPLGNDSGTTQKDGTRERLKKLHAVLLRDEAESGSKAPTFEEGTVPSLLSKKNLALFLRSFLLTKIDHQMRDLIALDALDLSYLRRLVATSSQTGGHGYRAALSSMQNDNENGFFSTGHRDKYFKFYVSDR